MDIRLDARVECTDGPCGQSTHVIINPATQKVTHFVMKEKGLRHTDHLVPFGCIVETTPDLIRLRCTKYELATLEPFVETELVQREFPHFDPVMSSFQAQPCVVLETEWVPVEQESVPPGELAVWRGARVKASGAYLGRVDGFLADLGTGHITHLVLREGRAWGRKDVTIAISGVVPYPRVPAALRSCGQKGIPTAIVISAGFRESGIDGLERERELIAIAREFDMRLIGPNCLGMIDTFTLLNASFAAGTPPRGPMAFASQSGALGAAILKRSSAFSARPAWGSPPNLSNLRLCSTSI